MGVNTVYGTAYRAVFDPALPPGRLPERPRRVLLTHGHADHIRYAEELRRAGATVFAPRLCLPLVEDPRLNHMATMGWAGPVPEDYITRYFVGPGARVDYTLEQGMALPGVEALATPGHTPGSLSYLVHTPRGLVLVAGDTVYGTGYLDATPVLYHTDTTAWLESLNRLARDPPDALVPGHGEPVEGRRASRSLIEANRAKIEEMLRLALEALDTGQWVTGDEAAARLAEATGYARSRRAYSILGPATRALLHALVIQGRAEMAIVRGVPAWRRR
jgi:glyoxylase-like metal-dependent hydrolase (beta-lactamase superfamily II)